MNDEIEDQLKRDRLAMRNEVKLLLLGELFFLRFFSGLFLFPKVSGLFFFFFSESRGGTKGSEAEKLV